MGREEAKSSSRRLAIKLSNDCKLIRMRKQEARQVLGQGLRVRR